VSTVTDQSGGTMPVTVAWVLGSHVAGLSEGEQEK
jgi:hypothetical protein